MSMTEKEKLQHWAENWKVTGPMMEEFRKQDLQKLTEADRGRIFNEIMHGMPIVPRQDDGLLEQQRYFQKPAPWKA